MGCAWHAPPRPGRSCSDIIPTLVPRAPKITDFALSTNPETETLLGHRVTGSSWLKASPEGRPVEADHEVDFWVDLKSGQEIHLES